jgi:Protein of unknown function (DUF1302)
MQRAFGACGTGIALVLVVLGLLAQPARAIEFWDGRIQVHGFYETRMSFGYEDFNANKGIDLYSWLHVLNIEIESEIAPDGWGPFDMVAAYARVEVKYDCVWSHACGIFPQADAFGNNPGNLPDRVQNGERLGLSGSQFTGDTRPYWFGDRNRLAGGLWADAKTGQRAAKSFVYGSTNVGLFGASAGPDTVLGDFPDIRNESGMPGSIAYGTGFTDPTTMLPGDDDAGLYLFDRTSRCKVGNDASPSSNLRGFSNRELIWSIDDCRLHPLGFNREIANPFADAASSPFGGDLNPVLLSINLDPTSTGFGAPLDADGIPDSTALPLRPGTEFAALPHNAKNPGQKRWASQGIFVPNLAVRKNIKKNKFSGFDQNFSLSELQWNHGASQEQTKELKELYGEWEMFESRLWIRGGKQTIVWGKTELFRNQDQWNPVDIAIGPLASLEESRIALWALRGIWSFYEVGPLEDVRLELAAIFDKFEPTDIGRCGEAFVPKLACAKSYGLWVHGENGTGVAGESRPPDPWQDGSGVEYGARVEFRYDRFSFALTEYYGYTDVPYQSLLFQYSRNVDPLTGRPRHTDSLGSCTTGAEPACLSPGIDPNGIPGDYDDGVIANHSINQSLFAWICAGTVGVAPAVDASACAFTLFNSPRNAGLGPFSSVFSSIAAGNEAGATRLNVLLGETPFTPGGAPVIQPILLAQFGPAGTNTLFPYASVAASPLVPLNYDGAADNPTFMPAERALFATYTTDAQEALWGCGVFYLTLCDAQGFDLANGDSSVMLQAFTWFEGTFFNSQWDTTDPTLPQPGTVDAVLQGDGMFAGNVDIMSKKDRKKFGLKPGDVATGSVAARYENDGNNIDDDGDGNKNKDLWILPGARYDPAAFAPALAALPPGTVLSPYLARHFALYNVAEDGTVGTRVHPFTGQVWASEMAIASWNFMMLAAGLGAADGTLNTGTLDRNNPLALGRCSFAQPQYCAFVSGLAAQARTTNSAVRAGGNGKFGRRNFVWQSVGDLALRYQARNILGFSTDFAEDTTKSSWGVEFTHVNNAISADNGSLDGIGKVDEFNLTISVDRPTFINFLNANRTFFINSQLFTSYLNGYKRTMLRDGPFTFLLLLNANTGYFQDRFLVSAAAVWDFKSDSGAFLPSVQYRFTENFSLTIGAAVLGGHWERRELGINQFSAQSDTTLNDNIYVQNGISPAQDLDNFFFRIRYTY